MTLQFAVAFQNLPGILECHIRFPDLPDLARQTGAGLQGWFAGAAMGRVQGRRTVEFGGIIGI